MNTDTHTASPVEPPVPDFSRATCELIDSYDTRRLDEILATELSDFLSTALAPVGFPKARYAVNLHRITYPSFIPEDCNRPTVASGLIAVPVGIKPERGENTTPTMPVVSYQHGTIFSNHEVPSNPEDSGETRLMIAQFAGQGYAVIGADYFGKGESAATETDAYLVKASTQQACLDMLRASLKVSSELGFRMGDLFLSGWSQGSWNTLVFLNKLESMDIKVSAAAIASAPTDLYALMNRWIHAPADIDAEYLPGLLAVQLNAYEKYYGMAGTAASAIKPEFQQVASELYLNKITWENFYDKTPARLQQFLKTEFMDAGSIGNSPIWKQIQKNQSYRWRSKTPLHTYYGDKDEVIPEYIAKLPVAYQTLMGGGETSAFPAGPEANHRGTFAYAIAHQKRWFDELRSNNS